MASSGINNGTLTALYVYVANTPTKIAHLTGNEISQSMNTRPASTKDSGGWEEILPGSKSWTFSGSGFFAEDASFGYEDLFDLWTSRTQVLVVQTTNVNGDKKYKGVGYITDLSREAPTEDSETFSVTINGTAALTKFTES